MTNPDEGRPSVAEKDEQAPEYEGQEEHRGNPNRSLPPVAGGAHGAAMAEVRRVREENDARARAHSRTEIVEEVAAAGVSGNEDVKPISIGTADGLLYINTHGEKVLDQDGVADLQRKVAKAFQAVS